MRLYKMELFKLFQNKIFKVGMLATTGLLFLYFWFAEVGGEISTVDGKFYSGYEAVQMNRKITEEFEGDLTDEKVNQIIEKYGLPAKLEENMPGWRDGNFLNDFVTRYFTNGAWENGVLPTERYFLGETELGKAYDEIGKTPYLAYTTGWKVFVEMLQFGLILGSILIICGVSTIFAEESQTKMLPLIFSTEEGRRKDVPAKILASLQKSLCFRTSISSLTYDKRRLKICSSPSSNDRIKIFPNDHPSSHPVQVNYFMQIVLSYKIPILLPNTLWQNKHLFPVQYTKSHICHLQFPS
jgi:hypothetical protein